MITNIRVLNRFAYRAYSKAGETIKSNINPAASTATTVNANVPGLSSNCVKPTTTPVGPGAAPNAAYKVPEYFCFDRFSFAEAEVEMAKFRCPQPSAIKK